MRRGSKKFEPHALAFVGGIAEKNDAGFLFFLRKWIGKDQHRVHGQRLIQVQQAAVRIDHDGLAGLAEAAVVGILPATTTRTLMKTRVLRRALSTLSVSGMVRLCCGSFHLAVNEGCHGVFPQCNAGLAIPHRATVPEVLPS